MVQTSSKPPGMYKTLQIIGSTTFPSTADRGISEPSTVFQGFCTKVSLVTCSHQAKVGRWHTVLEILYQRCYYKGFAQNSHYSSWHASGVPESLSLSLSGILVCFHSSLNLGVNTILMQLPPKLRRVYAWHARGQDDPAILIDHHHLIGSSFLDPDGSKYLRRYFVDLSSSTVPKSRF